jgi:hypothetical protein
LSFYNDRQAEELDEEGIKNAVGELLYNFKFCRTLNPFVWFLLGTWKPETSGYEEDRINRLVDNLRSVEGVTLVTVSYVWTNFLHYQQLAWKAWREIIS